MANSNRTGAMPAGIWHLIHKGLGRRLHRQQPVMMMAKADFFQRVQAGNALRHTNQYDQASQTEEPLCGALSFKHYPYLTLSVLNDIHDQPCIE